MSLFIVSYGMDPADIYGHSTWVIWVWYSSILGVVLEYFGPDYLSISGLVLEYFGLSTALFSPFKTRIMALIKRENKNNGIIIWWFRGKVVPLHTQIR